MLYFKPIVTLSVERFLRELKRVLLYDRQKHDLKTICSQSKSFFCVTYSAYFCKTLIKGFTIQKVIFIYSDNNFQTVIFMR